MKYGKSSFKGVASLEGVWSSQVPEPKSLYIRFISFCRKFTLSPILLNWRAHSISASEKECKTSKLNWQHSNIQPARLTRYVSREAFLLLWALCTPVFCMWDGTHTQTHNIYKHTVTQTKKKKRKKKIWTKTFTLKSFFKASWTRQILSY